MDDLTTGFSIRAEGDGLFLEESLVVPYGERITGTPELGSKTEEFEAGAFRDHASTIILDVHEGRPISGRIPAKETERGWVVGPGRLLDTERAREFVQAVREGVVGPSIEFEWSTTEKRRTSTGISHTRVKRVGGIAATYRAAYSGSFAVRHMEGSGVAETEVIEPQETPAAPVATSIEPKVGAVEMAKIAQDIADEAIRQYAARSAFSASGPVDPFEAFRGKTLGELVQRAVQPDAKRADAGVIQYAMRTIADIVTTSGANAGMVTPGVVGEIHGIVSRGRPAITAFGGPRAIPDVSGMSIDWPYFDGTLSSLVGAQSAQKAEITSVAVDIKKGTESLNTYAGGADIAYQLLRRASRSYLDAYTQILFTAWGIVTDAAFVTELESGSVTSDFAEALASVDATEFKNLLIDASIAVETATGQPAEFALASTTAFTQFAKLYTPVTSVPGLGGNTGFGGVDIRSLQVNVGGLPLIHTPSVTAGKIIVSNRQAAAWYEDGPFVAQDEDVLHLGKDVALWSMGAGARFIPAGIIEMYDVSP
jgi:hypothetical protein